MMGINKWRLFFLFCCCLFPPTSICVFDATGFCWERRSGPVSLQALNTQWTPDPNPTPSPSHVFIPFLLHSLLEFPTQHYRFFFLSFFFGLMFVTISFEMKMISVFPFPNTRCYILKTQTVMRHRPSTGITHTNKKKTNTPYLCLLCDVFKGMAVYVVPKTSVN